MLIECGKLTLLKKLIPDYISMSGAKAGSDLEKTLPQEDGEFSQKQAGMPLQEGQIIADVQSLTTQRSKYSGILLRFAKNTFLVLLSLAMGFVYYGVVKKEAEETLKTYILRQCNNSSSVSYSYATIKLGIVH